MSPDPTSPDLLPHNDSGPDPAGRLHGEAEAVWQAMTGVYEGFLAGDPDRVDALLHPDVTIWDSVEPAMAHGIAALRALRADRPVAGAGAPKVVALEATDPVIDVWGEVALVRHLLRVRLAPGGQPARPATAAGQTAQEAAAGPPLSDELVRNTSVWRKVEGRWLAVHNHEDVLGGV